jgi:NarL family two-component system response regulator LiaR
MEQPSTTIRVLLVDAEPSVRTMLEAMLQFEPDITVIASAADGATALRLAEIYRPDVVLLDPVLPGADGIQVVAQLRADCPTAGIILLTAVVDLRVEDSARAAEVTAYLFKPSPTQELLAAIRAAAQAHSQP